MCTLRKSYRLNTYIAFLDLLKAFDRVWRNFICFWKNGVQEKVWCLLKELYGNKVVLGDLESEWLNKDNGVKQGCILSPSLFSEVH